MSAADVSVVTVSYNVAPLLRAMLESVAQTDGLTVELIVVDNASVDGSADMVAAAFPQVHLIRNADNRGFGAGCNQGIAVATGRYIFLLNPDATLGVGGLRVLADYMDAHTAVGIAGPRLLWPDGRTQSSRRRFPTFATLLAESTIVQRYLPADAAIYRRFYMSDMPETAAHDADWLMGAALFCRREALTQVGGFDERFFMYSEELDLCRRVAARGWRIVFVPQAQVMHLEGQSSKRDIARRHISFQTSKIQYAAKYDGPLAAATLRSFLLATYAFQGAEEGAKWLLGHKRPLRRERLAMIRAVLASRLRAKNFSPNPLPKGKGNFAFVTAEYPPMAGGVGDYTARLAAALAADGAAVSVVTGADAGAVSNRAIGVVVRRVVPGWGWRSLGAVRRVLAESGARLALVEYQTGAYRMHPAVNLLPLYLRLFGGRPRPRVVAVFHDLREPYLWPKAGRARRWANALLMRTADAAVVTTAADATAAQARYRIRPDRLHVIPIGSNIVAPADCAAPAARFRQQHGLDGAFCIGYFGLLNATKGLDTLVRAVAALRAGPDGETYRLVIIGGETGDSDPTNRAYAARIAALIAQLGLTGAVVRTGHIDDAAVSAALTAADVVALPFIDGGTLRRGSLLAALAHARPTITTRPPATTAAPHSSHWCADSAVLRDAETVWLVPPSDPAALAEAIAHLRARPELRATLGAAGAVAVARLSWPAIAQKHTALYDNLAQHLRPHP